MPARRDWTLEQLATGVRAGDRRALARAITLVENSEPVAYDLVRELYPQTGRAYAVGVTGPPGVGKSSLISALVRHVRDAGRTVFIRRSRALRDDVRNCRQTQINQPDKMRHSGFHDCLRRRDRVHRRAEA